MKIIRFIVLLSFLMQPVFVVLPSTAARELQLAGQEVSPTPASGGGTGMPPRPIPEKPIPHHDVGKPSRAAQFTTEAIGIDEQGVEQSYTLTGLDALLADGTISDPFAGNYRLVEMEKIMTGAYQVGVNNFIVQTYDITPTLDLIPGSEYSPGNYWANDIAAGDLNGDDQMEQLAAWIDNITGDIYLSVSEIPTQPPRTSSAPAALAQGDGTGDLLVRGYDDALWHSHYDGIAWGPWVSAGGTLLSAPAIASRGNGQFDAFTIDTDNLTRWQHWENGVFSGTWTMIDEEGYWPEVEWVSPIPDVDPPAVVVHGDSQMDLFRRGADNTLRWRHFDGSAWGDWSSLGGFLSSAPSAVALENGGVQVFARGLEGNIWYRKYVGGSWGDWRWLDMPEGFTAASAPTAVSPQTGQIRLYLRGSDDALWQIQSSGGVWGYWVSTGGELGSRVAAAVWSDHSELFAQKMNDRLQHSSDGVSWSDFASLPSQVIYDTGFNAAPVPSIGDPPVRDNYYIDIETGYFTGERSEQIAVAYKSGTDQYKLALWDVRDGFKPYELAVLTGAISSKYSRIAAADVTGDGVDEIALVSVTDDEHYQVTIYRTYVDENGDWSLVLWKTPLPPMPIEKFGGTLRIASGDLNGYPELDDEVVVLIDSAWDTGVHYCLTVRLYIYDDEDLTDEPADDWHDCGELDVNGRQWWTGVGLAVGDINADGVDEIVDTWPTGFGGGNWPNLYRNIQILNARNYNPGNPESLGLVDDYEIPAYNNRSYNDTLAVGDLDRDEVNEIVFYQTNQLSAYDFENGEIVPLGDPMDDPWESPLYIKLVTGDFTGESLRVGAPTFRSQDHTGGITAIINMPPKHFDILDGTTYDVNSSDDLTYASYENAQHLGTEMSIQAQRSWSLASDTAWGIGDPKGTHVSGSISTTYGMHFQYSTLDFSEIVYGSKLDADSDDFVIYTDQSLDVWEYPVYQDDSGIPGSLIMVEFPDPGLTNRGGENIIATGNSTCDFWYAPEHQLNNVWSYAASAGQFKDFNGEILNKGSTITVGPNTKEEVTSWSTLSQVQRENSCSLSVERMFEWQIGGDTVNVSAAPFGVGATYEVHSPYLKSTTQDTYSTSTLSSLKVFGSNETNVSVWFNKINSSDYNYEVTPYLYWAKGGYLVLDYVTEPLDQIFWLRYDKPDPAFILPWTDGHCPGKELFSKDIQINPPFAYYGETVAITATLHNFSDEPAKDVPVRFFLGEPEDGYQIGSDQFVDLPGRARVDVPITWEATGAVQQRIYVVIDPEGAITEMHDETSNPENNNNVGFGVVALGNSGYLDPGGQKYFDYQYLTYTDTQNLPASFYVPTAATNKTMHLEMTPLSSDVSVRHGFRLDAYMGGSNRIPWDVTFQPMPAAVWFNYSESDIAGLDEDNLTLYHLNEDENRWEDAACGEYQRYPDDNIMIVPVCKVGSFAILSPVKPVPPVKSVFLPIVGR